MTANLSEISAGPRWKVIRDELQGVLANQTYGSTFLSIAEICERYEVSTITARRVLHELENQGLVERIQGKGTIVRRTQAGLSVRLVVPSSSRRDYMSYSAIMRRIISGIDEVARQHHVDFDITNEDHLQTLFAQDRPGFGLLLPPQISSKSIRFFQERSLPHVMVSPLRHVSSIASVSADRYQAGHLATEYLLGLGHRRIAYMLGDIRHSNFRDRLRGYRDALKAAGLKFSWSLVHQTDGLSVEKDEKALDELLALRHPPTAIITADDDYRAVHVLESLSRRGVKVPQEMSVLGYPNCPDSKLTTPPLSVVDAGYEQIGAQAMKMLLDKMHRGADAEVDVKAQSIFIKPQMVERASTGPVPSAGD